MARAFTMRGVEKHYPEFRLGPLNLELETGMVLGYIGPNGSGKSTTMHCLTGLVRPDAGTMRIFGTAADPHKPEWKRDFGYVGDVQAFFERWTGKQNLRFLSQFYPDWSEKRVLELADRFRLPLDKKAKDLSSGNRVKLSLVAALAHSPRLLLLDEPTSGLDPVVRTEVLEILFDVLSDGKRAIFYSTHILSDINRLADELAFIDNGQIVLRSSKEDLLNRWHRIAFQEDGNVPPLPAAVQMIREGKNWELISSDSVKTCEALRNLGAGNIQVFRMSLEEIAVQIMRTFPKNGEPSHQNREF